jgi:hypothetical protein
MYYLSLNQTVQVLIVQLPRRSNLKVTKTATVTVDEVYVFVGDVINYNIRVENTGYMTILNIVVKIL